MGLLQDFSTEDKKKRFDVTLEKTAQRRLTPEKVKEQLKYIADAASRNRQRKFRGQYSKNIPEPEAIIKAGETVYRYKAKIRLIKEGETRTADTLKEQFNSVMSVVVAAAKSHGWRVVAEGEEALKLKSAGLNEVVVQALAENKAKLEQNLEVDLPELNESSLKTFFGRIYNREPHIQIIHRANITAAMTKFDKRRHSLCWGPPGAAKTELFSAFMEFYGSDNVLHLDSTTATKAGLETLLLKRAQEGTLPPFLYLEEIEKYDLSNLHCLHSVMDQRGRIQRTNARIGTQIAEAKVVVWATCNSLKKLKEFEGGAILSRFSNRKQLYCPRPDKELMTRILLREVEEMGGEPAWVIPVVNFVFDEMKTNDPREAVALLDGREDLLDGKYLGWIRANLDAEKKEREREKNEET